MGSFAGSTPTRPKAATEAIDTLVLPAPLAAALLPESLWLESGTTRMERKTTFFAAQARPLQQLMQCLRFLTQLMARVGSTLENEKKEIMRSSASGGREAMLVVARLPVPIEAESVTLSVTWRYALEPGMLSLP